MQNYILSHFHVAPRPIANPVRANLIALAVVALVSITSVGKANATPIYWNLFNAEEESVLDSIFITYDSLADMLVDTNRTGSFSPDTFGDSAQNVVGSGAFAMEAKAVSEPPLLAIIALSLVGIGITRRRRKIY